MVTEDGELIIWKYDPIDPATLKPDPANYACEHGLVGDHSEDARETVGAWRWVGLQEHKEQILEILNNAQGAIDWGGAAGPVGYGAEVVDRWVTRKALWDIPYKSNCIFTSHCLEEVPDLGCWLAAAFTKLVSPAHLIVFVPSYRKANLRADVWPSHCHTYRLKTDHDPTGTWIPLDEVLSNGFTVDVAEHTSDGCLFLIARK